MLELVNFTIVTSPAGQDFEKAHFWMIEQYGTNKVDFIQIFLKILILNLQVINIIMISTR